MDHLKMKKQQFNWNYAKAIIIRTVQQSLTSMRPTVQTYAVVSTLLLGTFHAAHAGVVLLVSMDRFQTKLTDYSYLHNTHVCFHQLIKTAPMKPLIIFQEW